MSDSHKDVAVTEVSILGHGAQLHSGLENVVLQSTDFFLDWIAIPRISREGDAAIWASPTTVGTIEETETLLFFVSCHNWLFGFCRF